MSENKPDLMAELAEVVANWRVLERVSGEKAARDVFKLCADQLQAAMHNSAREG